MLRIFLILALLISVTAGDCSPGTTIGPCLCMQDSNGFTALQCTGVTDSDDVQFIITSANETYLSSVDITNSLALTTLPNDLFGAIAVGSFRVQNTGISEIANSVFSSPTSETLTSLRVRFNSLYASMNNDLIYGLTALEQIYISFNGLEGLVGNLVATNATYFDFSHNQINQISREYFTAANQGNVFLLGFNNLTSSSLTNGSFDFTTAENDLYLDVGYNKLTSGVALSVFTGKLPQKLILSSNGITTLDEGIFGPLLDALFAAYGNTAYVLMDNNKISCDCSISWLISANGRSLIQQVTCSDGRKLDSLTEDDFLDC